jgi:hypothetical protein
MNLVIPRFLLDWRIGLFALGFGAALFAAWCAPERQLRRHQAALMDAFGDRDFKKVERLVAPDYADRWKFDRERLIRESREVLRHFIALEVACAVGELRVDGRRATVEARIRLEGTGSPVARMAMDAVNALDGPFAFEWRRENLPWKWRLASADHPQLKVPEASGLF